jgi:hypothetical protein
MRFAAVLNPMRLTVIVDDPDLARALDALRARIEAHEGAIERIQRERLALIEEILTREESTDEG